ncbi:ABC transporter permease [Marilutibacter alkalisoli]|uniref:DUF3526 domain-containing protein n=1 Tax=Marilutibacter alkalisoli TaxID=2591633 RepID=A0A514BR75_9GAMM|nr:DUF3526 domain-containing protein [Lysobacter alkalisoli]QDH69893.1 DUF3526 domain-containing protein [Lysobacter alkalisoli]
MTNVLHTELALVLRSRLALVSLVLLAAIAALAVMAGLRTVESQRDAIERSVAAQRAEQALVARQYAGEEGDAGQVGYYTFHPTWDPPAPLAFAALGQRDVQPYLLRVRLLGLQAQLYESDTANPEMALAGTFDFAFVLVYLLPLVAIALVHDLVSGEREAGRLGLVLATASAPVRLWRRRLLLRYGLVLVSVLLPFAVGCMVAGVQLVQATAVAVVAMLYTAFWFGLFAFLAARVRSSANGAMAMFAVWLGLTLLLPTAANTLINQAVPAGRGVDLMLAQRQLVHAGWDEPKDVTFERFFNTHPEWRGTPPVTVRFHWKWYYAMHQAGDDAVVPQVAEYEASLRARQRWAERAGWLMPGIAVQVTMQRLANTDLEAQLRYREQIVAFHAALRRYFYPYLFNEVPFRTKDVDAMPGFTPAPASGLADRQSLVVLLVLAMLAALCANRLLRKVE